MFSNTLVPENLEVIKSIEVSGFPIEVGVLKDGTPFLSGRGLARACGISNSTLVGWGEVTPQLGDHHRAGKMANLLATYGYEGDRFFFRIPDGTKFEGKANVSAYPYKVCMAFLDYYAFEANKEEARNSLRILSEKQLPQFILEAIGQRPVKAIKPKYEPTPRISEPSPFETRPLRDGIPVGYFAVAQLASGDQVRSLQTALNLDVDTIFPTHIEKAWNRFWDIKKLWEQYGERFPMPQKDEDFLPARTYIYPTSALDEFKQWLNLRYIPERFPSYLQRKIKQVNFSNTYINQLPQAS